MWAAAKRNLLPQFDRDISKEQFVFDLEDRINYVHSMGGEVFLVVAETPKGTIPVGVVSLDLFQGRAWPHVIWFPEASPRNKVECGLQFLMSLKTDVSAMIIAAPINVHLYDHLCKYGVIRKVGTLRGYYDDANGFLYETVG